MKWLDELTPMVQNAHADYGPEMSETLERLTKALREYIARVEYLENKLRENNVEF